MNIWLKGFCVVLCVSILPSISAWADEPEAEDSPAKAEMAKQETHSKPAASSTAPSLGNGEPKANLPQSAPAQAIPPQPERPVRDPFESGLNPVETPVAPSPDQPVEIQTILEGISISPRGARTVINGEVYKEGEDKKGIKIIQIRKKEVDILINQSIRRTLSMLPGGTRDIPMPAEETSPPVSGEAEEAALPEGEQAESKEPTYA